MEGEAKEKPPKECNAFGGFSTLSGSVSLDEGGEFEIEKCGCPLVRQVG